MDDAEQAGAYADADFSESNTAFVERLCSRFPGLRAGTVWDIGCGPADIPLRLVRARPQLQVIGIDGSAAMLARATAAVEAAGAGGRIRLIHWTLGSAPEPAELAAPAAAAISNSLLHHLHRPEALWAWLRQRLAPGTPVLVMDLFRPASAASAQAIVDRYAADAPELLRRDFLASLHAAFTPGEVAEQLAAAGLGELMVEVTSDRHLCVHGRVPGGGH
jgi:SAM-dependent methyltransferase